MNEMPFGAWVSSRITFSLPKAEQTLRAHSIGLSALRSLGVPRILSSAPVPAPPLLANEVFLLGGDGTHRFVHQKQYFPQEPSFYERSWFRCARPGFDVVRVGKLLVGVLMCTELFFNEWARYYGRAGAHIIVVPRASGVEIERWRAAARMAAIVSGAYVLSSNHRGRASSGFTFGGHGFAFGPTGDLLVETSASQPLQVVNIDVAAVQAAKRQYPCTIPELVPEFDTLDNSKRARA